MEENSKVGTFFGKLFQSRDVAHLSHFRTKSFSQHLALDEYYKKIIKLTDTLVEAYQGNYEIIIINIPASSAADPATHLKTIRSYIDDSRNIFKESYIQNIIDEIMELINQTLYKIVNLK